MNYEEIARICHNVNRAYCVEIGESPVRWEDVPLEDRKLTVDGVEHVARYPDESAEDNHTHWLKKRLEAGWVYGVVKDYKKKESPAILEYKSLPPEQRVKNAIFITLVKQLLDA